MHRLDVLDELEAILIRQRDVGDDKIRSARADGGHRLLGVLGFGGDRKIRLVVDQGGESLTHHGMIVHDENRGLGGVGFPFCGAHGRSAALAAWCCTEQMTLVPALALRCTTSEPPMTPARYCMMRSPMPRSAGRVCGNPTPSSTIARMMRSPAA